VLAPAQNPLDLLRKRVIAEHAACGHALATAVVHAMAAGDLLREARGRLPHGEWLPWLASCGVPPRLAQRYMRLAKHRATIENATGETHLSVTAALALLADKKPEPAPVDLTQWRLDPLATILAEWQYAVGLVRQAFPDLNDEAVEERAIFLRFDAHRNGHWQTVETLRKSTFQTEAAPKLLEWKDDPAIAERENFEAEYWKRQAFRRKMEELATKVAKKRQAAE
jgi:hypothetical protein